MNATGEPNCNRSRAGARSGALCLDCSQITGLAQGGPACAPLNAVAGGPRAWALPASARTA